MLIKLSKGNKYNPYYALLKMRFNYTCLPFESKLFDADLYLKFDLNNQALQQQQQQQQQQQSQQQGQQQQQIHYQPFITSTNPPIFYTQQQSNLNTNHFGLFGVSGFTGFSGFSNLNSSQLVSTSNAAANTLAAITANPFQVNIISNANAWPGTSTGNNNGGANSFISAYGMGTIKQEYSNESYNLGPKLTGLLEVLPLNFKCISSSQGTTIEKTNSKQDLSIYMLPNCNTLLNSTNHMINQMNQQPNNLNLTTNQHQEQPLNYNLDTFDMNKNNDLIEDIILNIDESKVKLLFLNIPFSS